MNFTVETTIYIPIEYIIDFYKIDENTPFGRIHAAIDDYVMGMDDCDYHLVNADVKKRIFGEIVKRIITQMRTSGKK